MADPVAFKMFAPTPAEQDLSPILLGMQLDEQQSQATRQGVFQGLAQAASEAADRGAVEEERAHEAEKLGHLEDVVSQVTDPAVWKTESTEPWRADPTLAGLDPIDAKRTVMDRLMNGPNAMSYDDAFQQAETIVSPRYVRYMDPAKAAKTRAALAKGSIYWNEVGGAPGGFEMMINMAAGDTSYMSREEALEASRRDYLDTVRGADATRRELAGMQISAEQRAQERQIAARREEQAQEQRDRIASMREGASISEEESKTAFGRTKVLKQFDARITDTLNKRNTDEALKLMEARNAFESAHDAGMAAYNRETQLMLQKNEIEATTALAQAKEAGLSETEANAIEELQGVISQSLDREAAGPVPLAGVAGAVSGGTIGDFVAKFTKAATNAGFGDRTGKQIDLARFEVSIGADGEVHMVDLGGDSQRPVIPQKELDKITKSLFRNDMARFAVAMSQAYGGLYKNGNDLEVRYRVAKRFGMDQLLYQRLRLLGSSPTQAPATPEAAPEAAPAGPGSGVKLFPGVRKQ